MGQKRIYLYLALIAVLTVMLAITLDKALGIRESIRVSRLPTGVYLHYFDDTGAELWHQYCADPGDYFSGPVIRRNGNILLKFNNKPFACLDAEGNELWSYPEEGAQSIKGEVLVPFNALADVIYLAAESEDGYGIHALTGDGGLIWKHGLDRCASGAVNNDSIIDSCVSGGYLYTSSTDGVYAIGPDGVGMKVATHPRIKKSVDLRLGRIRPGLTGEALLAVNGMLHCYDRSGQRWAFDIDYPPVYAENRLGVLVDNTRYAADGSLVYVAYPLSDESAGILVLDGEGNVLVETMIESLVAYIKPLNHGGALLASVEREGPDLYRYHLTRIGPDGELAEQLQWECMYGGWHAACHPYLGFDDAALDTGEEFRYYSGNQVAVYGYSSGRSSLAPIEYANALSTNDRMYGLSMNTLYCQDYTGNDLWQSRSKVNNNGFDHLAGLYPSPVGGILVVGSVSKSPYGDR